MCAMRRPPRRVLVVDDSELMRAMLVDLIDSLDDFQVVAEASTGFQAIRLLHEKHPDIITLDIEMPDLGGLETLAYIMSESPRPVVMLSAGADATLDGESPTVRALELGAVDFVPKP